MTIPNRKKKLSDVSIVIPSFKGERYITQLAACLKEYYKNGSEIILVEDGSKDKTEDLFKGFFPSGKYIWQENSGVASARNMGVANANGSFVQLLDVDDTIEAEKIGIQLNYAIEHNLDIVYSDWQMVINKDGEKIYEPWSISHHQKDIIASLLRGWWNPPHSYLIRKKAYSEVLSDDKLINAQDFDLLVQMAIQGFKFGYCPGKFSYYFRYLNTTSLARGSRSQYWSDTEITIKKAVRELIKRKMLTDSYRQAAAERLFLVTRNVYKIDKKWSDRVFTEVREMDPKFFPSSQSKIFQLLYYLFGYFGAEKMIGIIKRNIAA